MKLIHLLEVYAIFYSTIVIAIVIILSFLEFKYRKEIAWVKIGLTLNKIKGKNIVLLPMQILSVIFLIDFLILWLISLILILDLNIIFLNSFISSIKPTLMGKEGDFFFLILFLGTAFGGRGWILVNQLTNALRNTSMHIDDKGHLKYTKNVF